MLFNVMTVKYEYILYCTECWNLSQTKIKVKAIPVTGLEGP
jgi:hypothetical protein